MTRMTARLLFTTTAIAAGFASTAMAQTTPHRAIGVDVSYWQGGTIDWAKVAAPIVLDPNTGVNIGGGGMEFAFIRATRGGTTGHYVSATNNSLSQRYDDPYTARNVAGARANGMLAGVYHYARIDLINNVTPADGNTGLDEANHFLETAQQFMRPGMIRPTLDVESGDVQTTPAQLTAWCMQFSDRILEKTGVRPLVYINSNYARNEVTSDLNVHDMWLARYLFTEASGSTTEIRNAAAATAQTGTPPTPNNYPHPYGVFKTTANPVPWDFWQYTDGGRTPGIPGNVDQDVANGDINYVKQFVIPAIWLTNANGDWSTASNWNGQVVLPTADDRVILERSSGDYLITHSSGTHVVKSMQVNERFTLSGGTLNVSEYVNATKPFGVSFGTLVTPTLANTSIVTLSGGVSVVDAITGTGTTTVSGGTLRTKNVRQATLNVTGGNVLLLGTGTSVVKSLSVTGNALLDVGDGAILLDYTGTSPLSAIFESLASGYTGGTWNGRGIVSTTLAPNEGVAFAEASSLFTNFATATFRGERVDNTSILIVNALYGDTDLNGSVDFDDLLQFARSYGTATTLGWKDGDTNYDAVVDFDDLLAVARNFNVVGASPLNSPAGFSATFEGDWALAQALVPEPTTLSVFAVVSMVAARRRRLRA